MKKKALSLLIIMCMVVAVIPFTSIKTNAATVTTPGNVGTEKVLERIDELANRLHGTYFTSDGQPANSSGDSRCNVLNVLASNSTIRNLIYTNKGKTGYRPTSDNNLPGHYGHDYGEVCYWGYSCFGFANFAEWYIFSDRCSDDVSTKVIKKGITFNYANMKAYAKPGDVIRITGGPWNFSGHSAIVKSIGSSCVTVLDANTSAVGETAGTSKIKLHDISYGGTVSINRATNSAEGWPSVTASNEKESGKVVLSWGKHDTATKYYIYRSTSKTSGFKYIDRTAGTSYIDAGGEASYLYYYKIKAVTSEGKVLSVSDIVSRTCDCAQPKIVSISNVASTGKIKLKWKDVANADRYDIYRCVDGGTYKKMKTFSTKMNTGKTYSYINTTAKAGEKYWYKVVARNSNNIGADSASSTGWARTCDLAKPTNVKASNATKGKIKVTWNKVEGATSYRIYRKTGKNGTYKLQYTTTKCSYNNSAVKKGKTYYYKIKAVMKSNADATSAYSAVVNKKVR